MVITIILAIFIAVYVGYVIYKRFSKKSGGCHDCSDVGCPLVDLNDRKKYK